MRFANILDKTATLMSMNSYDREFFLFLSFIFTGHTFITALYS